MATVFLAQDERLGRMVAVKRLHGETTEEIARRFRREARLGAALNHPNVVAIYDITSDDEGVLIVMEYVEGETLRDEISGGRMAPERAIAVLRGIAAALDYAHENGVVHRDVKPANVLIRRDGQVKLADLGIATAAEQSKITRSGAVLGTAAYMAPERLDGRPGGPGVDVYALAAVAFEMFCGRKAYEGNTPLEVAHKVVNEPTPDVRRCLPDAPDGLVDAIKRGLAWEPDQRPESAGALVAAIEAALPRAAAGAAVAPAPAAAGQAGAGDGDAARGAAAAREPEASGDTGSTGAATPARVLPPERVRTRPARAAAAPAAPAPAETAGGDGSDPPAYERTASRRRPELPAIAAVLGVLALLAIVLVTAGGDDGQSPRSDGDRAERAAPKDGGSEAKGESGPEGSDSRSQTPAAPQAPGGGSAPAAGTPAAAVNDFYQRAARDDYAGAWALATPRAQATLGGFRSFSAGQSSLVSISFPKLKGRERGDTATVQLRSEAVHRDRVDRCQGSIDLVRSAGAWKLDDFHIANCVKSPRP
jgi:serine/threonine-protein kinase